MPAPAAKSSAARSRLPLRSSALPHVTSTPPWPGASSAARKRSCAAVKSASAPARSPLAASARATSVCVIPSAPVAAAPAELERLLEERQPEIRLAERARTVPERAERVRLAALVAQLPEAQERLVEQRAGLVLSTLAAGEHRQIREAVRLGRPAREAVEVHDRLLEERPQASFRPLRQDGEAERDAFEERCRVRHVRQRVQRRLEAASRAFDLVEVVGHERRRVEDRGAHRPVVVGYESECVLARTGAGLEAETGVVEQGRAMDDVRGER